MNTSGCETFMLFQPKPIVDTIQEHEKYGNSGDKFYPIGRAIVNGYEGFSNILNKILDVSTAKKNLSPDKSLIRLTSGRSIFLLLQFQTPVEVAKTFSRGLTNTLNAVGGKIVGL